MRRSRSIRALVVVGWMLALASPALAHGDMDAHPLARDMRAGPYSVSLWHVYPDTADAMDPHLIVMIDRVAAAAPVTEVAVEVDSSPLAVHPSTSTGNGWETDRGVVKGDVVAITISDGTQGWRLDPIVVGQMATSMFPMQLLIYISSALTAVTALWVASRTFRAWRRPVRSADRPSPQEGLA
jgi:hypothetical protein